MGPAYRPAAYSRHTCGGMVYIQRHTRGLHDVPSSAERPLGSFFTFTYKYRSRLSRRTLLLHQFPQLSSTFIHTAMSTLSPHYTASATSSLSSLSEDSKHQSLLSDVGLPSHARVLAAAHVRIYQSAFGASGDSWRFTGLRGLLVFTEHQTTDSSDAEENSCFRLVDIETGKGVIWRHQIPPLFDYRADKPFFHVFSGCSRMFGFRFDEDLDAEMFYKRVADHLRISASLCPRHRPRQSTSPASSIAPSLLARKAVSRSTISAPTPGTFVHVAHVGVSKDGRIEATANVDPGWTAFLEKLQGHGASEETTIKDLSFGEGVIAGARTSLVHEIEGPVVPATRTPSIAGPWKKGRLVQRRSLRSLLGVAGA